MVINTEIIVNSFIRTARAKLLDVYLVKRGEAVSGEIFLRLNNLKGFSRLFTYKKSSKDKYWQTYSADSWEEDAIINNKLDKAMSIDEDIWILELEDKEGMYPDF